MKKTSADQKRKMREYYYANQEYFIAKQKKRYREHKDEINAYHRKWFKRNKVAILKQKKQYRDNLKYTVLSKYGGTPPKCKCCKEDNLGFLTIDHINNDGFKHRRTTGRNIYLYLRNMGFPKGYRVQCYNCNCGRSKNGGVCPHKIKRVK